MTNLESYRSIFRNTFEVEDDALNDGFTFQDVEAWDSLAHLTLIGELEDTFDIMLETDDILHFGGFENGIRILEKHGVDFTS